MPSSSWAFIAKIFGLRSPNSRETGASSDSGYGDRTVIKSTPSRPEKSIGATFLSSHVGYPGKNDDCWVWSESLIWWSFSTLGAPNGEHATTTAQIWSYGSMNIPWYDRVMKVDKMSISLEAHLGDEVRSAAKKAGMGVSTWLAQAARAKLRSEALRDYLASRERRHGRITVEELSRAQKS